MKQDVSRLHPHSPTRRGRAPSAACDAAAHPSREQGDERLAQLRTQLTAAVRASDIATARALLADTPPWGDAQLDQLAARLYMAWHAWPQAAAVLGRMTPPADQQLSHQTQLNLARNLACAQRHQPALYEVLAGDIPKPESVQYSLHRLSGGDLTISRQLPGQPAMLLSAGPVPRQAAAKACESLKPILQRHQPLGLDGAGDGYLLAAMAETAFPGLHGQQGVVHIFEPDAQALLHAMMIHDYAGEEGVLSQQRFVWHVGPQWETSYEKRMLEDELMLLPPGPVAKLSGGNPRLAALLSRVQHEQDRRSEQLSRELATHYGQAGEPAFGNRLARFVRLCESSGKGFTNPPGHGDSPDRPRVLLVTSRFTSVLQHETARIARAFESLGWQTRILIETRDHHCMTRLAVQQALVDFKPDLLFMLDHLRHEQGDVLPPGLPCCCWVQDLLPNITNEQAGRQVDELQWVVTFCKPLLTRRHGYPAARCIDAPIMMASEPSLPASWKQDGPDLAYVSNLSQEAGGMVAATLSRLPEAQQGFVGACAQAVVAHYENGGCLPGKPDIARLITPVLAASLPGLPEDPQRQTVVAQVVDLLWNPLNVGLYRQQALAWMADIAEARGLSLAIFGRGWASHPRFAQYARGVIQPGDELNELVRTTKINLNLEPYPCTTHVRLLDGLTAGGFYLVRQHPADITLPALAAMLEKHDQAGAIATDDDARQRLPASLQNELETLLTAAAGISYDPQPDVIAQLRSYQQAGVIAPQDGSTQGWALLPELAKVSFHDHASAAAAVERFMHDADARQRIAAVQRRSVLDRLTLRQGLGRILAHIARDTQALIEQQAKAASPLSSRRIA